jgi:hypothetical protein
MSTSEQIKNLEAQKESIIKESAELDLKLQNNEVEHRDYEEKMATLLSGKGKEEALAAIDLRLIELMELQKAERQRKNNLMITVGSTALLVLVLAVISFTFLKPGGLTGYVVADQPVEQVHEFNQEYLTSSDTTLSYERLKGLKITGSIEGPGAVVRLKTATREYLVANLTGTSAKTFTLTTDRKSYSVGESVIITINPEIATKSVYVQKGENNTLLNETTFLPIEEGEYTIVAIITTENDILRLSLNFTVQNESQDNTTNEVVSATENMNENTFSDLCQESCLLQEEENNPTISVELLEGSKLTISDLLTIEMQTPTQPVQVKTFADTNLNIGESKSYVLDEYFSNPSGGNLSYDVSQVQGVTAIVSTNILTLTGEVNGEYSAHVYATDGNSMLTGNDFKITVGSEVQNQTNKTETSPTPETNETTNTTINQTITSAPTGPDCNDPNPNNRPLSCIEGSEDEYFTPKIIYLENIDKAPVARVTTFGNLVIQGNLVQNSQSSPSSSDFRVSRSTPESESETTVAWINSQTGDLHLKGSLYEEQIDLVPPNTDAFLVQNRKGTTLGYFDKASGNLYLRGNLITEKKELD